VSQLTAFAYPALSVVFLGSAVRAWGRYAERRRAGWFVAGVILGAVGIDGLRALHTLLTFRTRNERWLIWGLVALSVAAVLRQTWNALAPEPAGEPSRADEPDADEPSPTNAAAEPSAHAPPAADPPRTAQPPNAPPPAAEPEPEA